MFFFRVVLAKVEESGKKNLMWRDYSKTSVLQQSNGYTCYFYCKKKKKKKKKKKTQSFVMSPTVGDLFKSPAENGARNDTSFSARNDQTV